MSRSLFIVLLVPPLLAGGCISDPLVVRLRGDLDVENSQDRVFRIEFSSNNERWADSSSLTFAKGSLVEAVLYGTGETPDDFYIGPIIPPDRARDVVYDVTILEFGRRAHLKLPVTKLVDPGVVLSHGDEIIARIHVPEDINNTTITSAEVRTPRDY